MVAAALLVAATVLAPMVGLGLEMGRGPAARQWAELDEVLVERAVATLVLALGATLLALGIAIPFALALRRARFPGVRVLKALYVAPLLVPPHIQAIGWMRIIGRQGTLTAWLNERFGCELDVRAGFLEVGGRDVFYPGATWMLACAFWPLAALIISAGLERIDPRPEEAALFVPRRPRGLRGLIHGICHGRWYLFLFPRAQRQGLESATLPLLSAHVLAGAFFVFIFAAGCYPIPALLDTPSIMYTVFITASQVAPAAAGVIAMPLVLMTVLALVVVEVFGSERVFQNRARPRPAPASIRPRNLRAGAFAWLAVLVTAGLPFEALVRKAGGIETYRLIFDNVKEDLARSFQLAFEGGLVVALGGLVIGLAADRMKRSRGFLLEATTLLPFAFPAVVVGVAVNVFWANIANALARIAGHSALLGALADFVEHGVYRGEGIFMACYLMLFLCFATRCVRTALSRIEPRQIEAGLLSGRSPRARFWAIVAPQILPGFLAGFVIAFILCLGELGASLIVQPPDWSTVQIRIFNMIHFARDEEVAALCVMLVSAVVLPVLLYVLASNRKVEVL